MIKISACVTTSLCGFFLDTKLYLICFVFWWEIYTAIVNNHIIASKFKHCHFLSFFGLRCLPALHHYYYPPWRSSYNNAMWENGRTKELFPYILVITLCPQYFSYTIVVFINCYLPALLLHPPDSIILSQVSKHTRM